jgi:hypothetical protein
VNASADVWASFSHDPRTPAHAGLRASDQDRDLIQQVLAEAYADGRLDREEFDTRSARAGAARTLGELPPLVSDLVAVQAGGGALSRADDEDLQRRAVEKWAGDRRDAFWTFLSASLICWVIWVVGSWGPSGFDPYFPWPIFVSVGTGLNVARRQVQRQAIIDSERRRLERKRAKERRRELEPGERSDEPDDSDGSG